MEPIELTIPRSVLVHDRGRQYLLQVKPIPKEAWLRYFDAVVSTSEYRDGKQVDSFDNTTARRELAESVLIHAEGYKSDKPLTEIPGWQALLPPSHLAAVGNVLTSATLSSGESEALTLGRETILIDAIWGADAEGRMLKHVGLKHVLRTPTADQHRRYSRDSSRSVIVGGSRSGSTRWLGAQRTLAELYDELVESVDGYTIERRPPANAEEIARHMDTFHKVAAALALFSSATPDVTEDATA